MKTFHYIVYSILWFLELLFGTIFAKDPCKSNKCLVKACCSKECDEKLHYLRYCGGRGSIFFQRFCGISILISCLALILALTHIVFIAP